MVYFQCETCIETLKKKQVENHYTHQCKNAQYFRCITCHKLFDRETIKAHTSCMSEDEKHKKNYILRDKTRLFDHQYRVLYLKCSSSVKTLIPFLKAATIYKSL